jgi:hypothetical protein
VHVPAELWDQPVPSGPRVLPKLAVLLTVCCDGPRERYDHDHGPRLDARAAGGIPRRL